MTMPNHPAPMAPSAIAIVRAVSPMTGASPTTTATQTTRPAKSLRITPVVAAYQKASPAVANISTQRLVRTVCPHCKESYKPDPDKLPRDFKLEKGEVLHRGVGCRKCRGTGYFGRTGIFELMLADDAVRDKIMARAPASQIYAAARKGGVKLMREDGWAKVRAGVTTPEEVMRSSTA